MLGMINDNIRKYRTEVFAEIGGNRETLKTLNKIQKEITSMKRQMAYPSSFKKNKMANEKKKLLKSVKESERALDNISQMTKQEVIADANAKMKPVMVFVCEVFGLQKYRVVSGNREYDLALARAVFAKTCKEMGMTLKDIARFLNRKDHTSVMQMIEPESYEKRLAKTAMSEMYRKMSDKVLNEFT